MPIVGRLDQYASMISVGEFDETTANSPSITGLGTYYASEFSENVGIATTMTANVFPPYDIVYDEFAGVLYGPGPGTFMRQNTDKSVIVYSEINEIGLSPSYIILPSTTTMNEGSSVTFTVNTSNVNVGSGTTFFYNISGSVGIASTDFTNNSLSGSFIISGTDSFGVGSTTLTLSNDLFVDNTETFNMNLRTGSISGPIVATSQNVTINDTSTPELYSFTTTLFTTGGSVGRDGPSLIQAISGLSGPEVNSWKNNTLFFNTSTGIQLWTVPRTATYFIEAFGAQGGTSGSFIGGRGVKMSGNFAFTEGEIIRILVGQQGETGGHSQNTGQFVSAGGGGTFVVRTPYNTNASILLIAGGGGGAAQNTWTNAAGGAASLTNNGNSGQGGVSGGTAGGGGNGGSNDGSGPGGAGFLGNGLVDPLSGNPAGDNSKSFINGGKGGRNSRSWGGPEIYGGFGGGGGGGGLAAGGGGGYSGGGGGTWSSQQAGGGGGSYNNGTSQSNLGDTKTGNGQVTITRL